MARTHARTLVAVIEDHLPTRLDEPEPHGVVHVAEVPDLMAGLARVQIYRAGHDLEAPAPGRFVCGCKRGVRR